MATTSQDNLVIGTMCGTSMDSLDIALVEFTADSHPKVLRADSYALPKDYKTRYLGIIDAKDSTSLQELGELDAWTGRVYAELINKFIIENQLDRKQIQAVANHGQTLWHAPNAREPFSMQIGSSSHIAQLTQITTVGDFRNPDIAAGGQGAPLAPLLHREIFFNQSEPRCIVNIGGLSNVSILQLDKYIGFDTGPGNVLLDCWTAQHFAMPYDKDGEVAATGNVIPELLNAMLGDPYFNKTPPKSTGREYFNPAWLQKYLQDFASNNYIPEDVLATLVALTSQTIVTAIKEHAVHATQVYVCGGGAKNLQIIAGLSSLLEKQVHTTSVLGVAPDWIEATLFAWLAYKRINRLPSDLTEITGAKQPVILGAVYEV